MFIKWTHCDPGASRLVERRLRTAELASHQHPASLPLNRTGVQPYVCISRMVGSGGTDVARLLGEQLGWTVYDKEILQEMAGDDLARRQVYSSLDERHLSWTEQTLRALMDAGFCRNDYIHRLGKTMLCLAQARPAIFIGRCADLILPREQGLRVRFVAPRDKCLHDFAERYQLTLPKAEIELKRVEKEREGFVRSEFHREPSDPARYDLVINLGQFSQADAADIVRNVMRMRHLISG